MKRALLIFAIAGVMSAQTTHPIANPESPKVGADLTAKPPVLSDAQKAAFFKAQAQLQAAIMESDAASQKLTKMRDALAAEVKQIQDACGKDFQPQMNHDGDPVCVAKPAAKPDVKTEPKK